MWAWTHWHTCVGTHLSSDAPSVGSAPLGLQAGGWTGLGAKERQSPHLSHPCSITPCPKLRLSAPATPPLLSPQGPGAHSQSKVAGRAETSLPRCRLVRVVECFRELPAGRERERASVSPQYVLGFKTRPWRLGREGNGDPLQYSCLENPMDGGA